MHNSLFTFQKVYLAWINSGSPLQTNETPCSEDSTVHQELESSSGGKEVPLQDTVYSTSAIPISGNELCEYKGTPRWQLTIFPINWPYTELDVLAASLAKESEEEA